MAKKKRKHRNPVAPRVHSAPGSGNAPSRPSNPAPGAAPAASAAAPPKTAPKTAKEARPRRQTPVSRQAAKRRRNRQRNWLIVGTIVALLLAALIVPRIMGSRAVRELNALGESAGCTDVDGTGDSGAADHLADGEGTKYDTQPPSHGAHSVQPLPGGVYEEELSGDPSEDLTLFRAVHSLEHGAVILWYDGLKDEQVDELAREYRDEEKVLVAPYKGLRKDTHFAMTAWGRMMTCEKMSTRVADKFIDVYRGARTAPEPNNPI